MTTSGLRVQFESEHGRTHYVIGSADKVDSFIDSLLNGKHEQNCAVVYSLDRPSLASGYPRQWWRDSDVHRMARGRVLSAG
jgi:hypothetical protein